MPIDPKKIERWKRWAEASREARAALPTDARFRPSMVTDIAGEAIPALLAEREERESFLREAKRAQDMIDAAPPLPASSLNGSVAYLLARRTERDEMLALLREIEWSGEEFLDYDLSRSACPKCRGIDPSEIEDDYDRGKAADANLRIGHAPDCRLAAFLRPGA